MLGLGGDERLGCSQPQKQGWACADWRGLAGLGDAAGMKQGEALVEELGSGWIREEPVPGTAPPQPYCETLAKWQLLSFLGLIKVSGYSSALPSSNPIPPQPQWALGS